MRKPRSDFPWHKVRQFIDDLAREAAASPDGSIRVTPATQRYVKFQRYLHRKATVADPIASRDALIELATEFGLSPFKARTTFNALQAISSNYRPSKRTEELEKARYFGKTLKDIHESLRILSSFASEIISENCQPKDEIVEKQLENAAHFWADKVRQESEKSGKTAMWESKATPNGFVHRAATAHGHTDHTYNSQDVIRRWLHNTVLVKELVDTILAKEKRKLATSADPGLSDEDMTAKVRLDGVLLPALYEHLTGDVYEFRKKDRDFIIDERGPRFAVMCYGVMGLPAPGFELLKAHKAKAKKALQNAAG